MLLPVLPGRGSEGFAKLAGKIVAVIKAGLKGDFCHPQIGAPKQGGGVIDTQLNQIRNRGDFHGRLKISHEAAF